MQVFCVCKCNRNRNLSIPDPELCYALCQSANFTTYADYELIVALYIRPECLAGHYCPFSRVIQPLAPINFMNIYWMNIGPELTNSIKLDSNGKGMDNFGMLSLAISSVFVFVPRSNLGSMHYDQNYLTYLLKYTTLDTSTWQSIDCGNCNIRLEGELVWNADSNYTKTGSHEIVQVKTTRDEFNTLRAFPNPTQENCYVVPTEKQRIRYIIRVGFYYGNYDSLSKPPVFDLFIDNIKWTTIDTSINYGEPLYEEIIYENKESGFFKICLSRIKDGGVPFINSIEAVPLFDDLYSEMEANATYNLVTRVNWGGPEVRFDEDNSDEIYNRIWSKADEMPYHSDSGFPDLTLTYENYPPFPVLMDAIEPNFDASEPIIMTIDLPQLTPQSAYIVFYLAQLNFRGLNQNRTVKIEINSQDQGTVEAPDYGETTVVTKYPVMVSGPSINITLTRGDEWSLPPMIAAMEVFTKWDSNVHLKSAAATEYFFFVYPLTIFAMLSLMA
ncbi:Leucine-rich repeat receptor-like serine/threonine-protein kinase [Heracleum sosnowskyi]|uniref:Leucine-rich repeat receptor-like serine/threonine-protein kinase n=1 Tax=Heracleum sosnowskyi TaxID=360622 RepID=A0AAD8HC97_9APIA|nr:Leucine-rich repeat receptor-like serine/threonine-protein kinase [Heracleum sosnowskyi]